MAITTGTQSNEFEAADSRFFNIIEGNETRETWSHLGKQLIDASGLVAMQDELTNLADILHENAGHPLGRSLAPLYRTSIHETRDALQDGLDVDEGFIVIGSKIDADRTFPSYISLKNEYGIPVNPSGFMIPAEKVTAHQVNLRENTEESLFRPVIDMRVQTDGDPTISRFIAPGEITEETSPGRWYRFPLSTTVVAVYS